MPTTLYRKYRPVKFSEIIGQQHIVQTLSNAIKNDHISHAYLFTGPRGTGKTSMARLFAKAVNCQKGKDPEPCLACESCKNIAGNQSLDVIEIDAASHTGVENIRELKETVKLPPSFAKYKVYIIDEVHMLSIGAFNALLKTLEEPPSHVIFILATTEIHKVPDTILSRCQRFDFVRLSLENIIKKLSSISKKEGVKIDKSSLETIALSAEGGMRDAESLLSQIMALEDKNITSKEVEEILGTAQHQTVENMTGFIIEKDILSSLSLVNELSENGYDLSVFIKSLLNYLRQLMLISINPELSKNFSYELTSEQIDKLNGFSKKSDTSFILRIIESLIESQDKIKSSFMPQLPFELALIKSIDSGRKPATRMEKEEAPKETNEKSDENEKNDSKINDGSSSSQEEEVSADTNISAPGNDADIDDVKENWNKLLDDIKHYNHSLNALLSNCQPVKSEDGTIIIAAKYIFHKDKLNESENRLTIAKVLGKILGSNVKILVVTEEEAGIKIETKPAESEKAKTDDSPDKKNASLLDDAMEIMGGKVVDDK